MTKIIPVMKHLFRLDSNNTFSELINSVNNIAPVALLIGVLSIVILVIWDRPAFKKKKFFKNLPGPLVVVIVGILINVFFHNSRNPLFISVHSQLVNLPIAKDFASFASFFMFPKWEYLGNADCLDYRTDHRACCQY